MEGHTWERPHGHMAEFIDLRRKRPTHSAWYGPAIQITRHPDGKYEFPCLTLRSD
jgi:hypothetical protein